MTISRSRAALAFLGSTALPAMPAHATAQPSEPGYSFDQPAQKTPEDYGVDIAPRLATVKVVEPAKRQAGIKVGSVDELIAKLKTLGVVA